MSEKGLLKVRQNKKHKWFAMVDIATKSMPVNIYEFKDDSLNNKECVVYREHGKIVKIEIDGKELPGKKGGGTVPAQRSAPHSYGRNPVPQKVWPGSMNWRRVNSPIDTRDLSFQEVDNFNLKLNKAARFENGKFYIMRNEKNIKYKIKADFNGIDFKYLTDRYVKSINNGNFANKQFSFKPDWRLVVGLGGESVYETSMTLHHIYGFPYIPGSGIKGVVRNWIIQEAFEADEFAAIADKRFCDIFGCPEELKKDKHSGKSYYKEARSGNVTFFDALPLEVPKIEVDIMNPHYSKYYADETANTPPADYLDPVPVNFLTVKQTLFQFILGVKSSRNLDQLTLGTHSGTMMEVISAFLKEALEEGGIGAKTAVGYGYGVVS